MKNSIYHTEGISLSANLLADLKILCADYPTDKIFVLLDQNTAQLCWPDVKDFAKIQDHHIMVIEPGERNKNLQQVERVWAFLGENRADRKSVLINIGGGMLTDLGGFAAASFKRGIDFINIPTTLLAMVDASVGGKTGINFRGFKNEIGIIEEAKHVFLYPPFLQTLDDANYKSGYAEILKAALIRDEKLWTDLKGFDLEKKDESKLAELLWRAVMIKKWFVDEDPREAGVRKALNFGHTIGHALESHHLQIGKPILHGFAVAYGMVLESRIAVDKRGLDRKQYNEIKAYLSKVYGPIPEVNESRSELLNWMRFDKKNERNQINFTLLNKIGTFEINNYLSEEEILSYLIKA